MPHERHSFPELNAIAKAIRAKSHSKLMEIQLTALGVFVRDSS